MKKLFSGFIYYPYLSTVKQILIMATDNTYLTDAEKQSIKALNFAATFDGIITSEYDIKYMLTKGIEKFVAKKRQHLAKVTDTAYPIRIKY